MFLTPDRIQQTLHTQTQAVADFNKRLFDWQLSQLSLVEKQMADTMSASSKAIQASVDAATAMQAQLVDMVGTSAPAES